MQHLALGLVMVSLVATAQRCPSDGVTFLQFAKQGLDPCLMTIDTGTCSAGQCVGCPGGATIPSNAASFPDDQLLCDCNGTGQACTLSAGNDPPYAFRDSDDCLICKGSNNCCRDFNVKDMGAVCCSDGACVDSTITLAAESECQQDVCCSDGSCGLSTFSGVRRMSCTDNNVCDQVTAELSGDLYCSGGCSMATFDFEAGEQCVRCDGTNDCASATMSFDASASVSNLHCGEDACFRLDLTVSAGKDLRMKCEASACRELDAKVSGNLIIVCDGANACDMANFNKLGAGKCKCIPMGAASCPGICDDDELSFDAPERCADDKDTACCAEDGCAECCPKSNGTVIGDPHIHTFKGDHYTLLREGSFLLWHFALKQPKQVEWQIFAHYSGRQSFTKGLLLVDTSGQQPSKMEITAEQCQWQTNGVKGTEWLSINEAPLPTNPSSHLKLLDNDAGMKQVQFFVADDPVATLKVQCRKGRHINVQLHMTNQKWERYVSGQLKGSQSQSSAWGPSMLQLALKEDQEFEMKKTWEELGGSPHGQQYLQSFDDSQNLGLLQLCYGQAEAEARAICRKHLGDQDPTYFEECVFDVCAGAGEAGAEMVAELLKS